MKLLFIGILLLSTLLMDAAVRHWFKIPERYVFKGVWFGMFPTYLFLMLFTTISLFFPLEQIILTLCRNVSIIFFLVATFLFMLSTIFSKKNALN